MKQTYTCKNCFNDSSEKSFHELFIIDNKICSDCIFKMHPFFKEFKILNVNGLAIFPYKDLVKDMIFRFKGCYDFEMKYTFLSFFKKELKAKYKNYILIPSPSFIESNNERGFNHVVEAFSILKIPIMQLLIKTQNRSQHKLGFNERLKIGEIIEIVNKNINLSDKKILLVDDIVTTGSTLKSSIELLKKYKPKKIQILVIAKTEFSKEDKAKLPPNYPILD